MTTFFSTLGRKERELSNESNDIVVNAINDGTLDVTDIYSVRDFISSLKDRSEEVKLEAIDTLRRIRSEVAYNLSDDILGTIN